MKVVVAWSGLPDYSLSLISFIEANGANIELIVIGTDTSTRTEEIRKKIKSNVYHLDKTKVYGWAEIGLAAAPDLYIYTGWNILPFMTFALNAMMSRCICVNMVDNCYKSSIRQLFGGFLFRSCISIFSHFTWVPGRSGSKLIEYYGRERNRIYPNLYPVSPEFYSSKKLSFNRKISFVGQLILRKNVQFLIDAFLRSRAPLCGWRLVIIGDGSLRESLSTKEGVDMMGSCSSEVVATHLRESSIFVLPSHEDHWGVVVGEAAASGCALIVSNAVGSGVDLVSKANGYIIDPRNIIQLQEIFNVLAQDDLLVQELGEASREVAKQYSTSCSMNIFNDFVRSIRFFKHVI